MKAIRLVFLSLLVAASLRAQTITLGSISKLNYCFGDTIVVAYQASGTFAGDNYFFAEVSDANGSFASYTIWGHSTGMKDSFYVPLQNTGSQIRIRVASNNPYNTSADNGANIRVSTPPIGLPGVVWSGDVHAARLDRDPLPLGIINRPMMLGNGVPNFDSLLYWKFDQDATPSTSNSNRPLVAYKSIGLKTGILTVTNPDGCSTANPFQYTILGCNPVIPKNVQIITSNTSGSDKFVWVKAGATYSARSLDSSQTIFVEPGGAVIANGESWNTYYIRNGGSISVIHGSGTEVLNSGMKVDVGFDTLYCDNLTFDYSEVDADVSPQEVHPLSIYQSSNEVRAYGEGELTMGVVDLLGREYLAKQGSSKLDIDLSSLPAGVYFAVVTSGDEKIVKRIVVVH